MDLATLPLLRPICYGNKKMESAIRAKILDEA